MKKILIFVLSFSLTTLGFGQIVPSLVGNQFDFLACPNMLLQPYSYGPWQPQCQCPGPITGSSASLDDYVWVDDDATLGGLTADGLRFGSSGDTGFYETSDGELLFDGSALKSYLAASNSNGWYLPDIASTSTTPTLVPDRTDVDTGIGNNGAGQLSLIADKLEMVRLINHATNDQVVLYPSQGPTGNALCPGLAFGDEDTGFYESADDLLAFSSGGSCVASVDSVSASTDNVTVFENEAGYGIKLENTNAGADGPAINLYHNETSASASDIIGSVNFAANNDTPAKVEFGSIEGIVVDPTTGSEDSKLTLFNYINGSRTNMLTIGGILYGGSNEPRVGINEASPDTALHITAKYSEIKLENSGAFSAVETYSGTTMKGFFGYRQSADNCVKFSHSETGVSVATNQLTINEGNVGIGEIASSEALEITESTTADKGIFLTGTKSGTVGPNITLHFNDGSEGQDNDVVGSIEFSGMDDAGTPAVEKLAEIKAVCTDASNTTNDGKFEFYTVTDDVDTLSCTIEGTTVTATTFSGDLTGDVTGNADTATALAANGANCSAGQAPLGVDASGAAESCFDVWTEAENTAAAYIANVSEDTTPELGGALDCNSNGLTEAGSIAGATTYTGSGKIEITSSNTGIEIGDGTAADITLLTADEDTQDGILIWDHTDDQFSTNYGLEVGTTSGGVVSGGLVSAAGNIYTTSGDIYSSDGALASTPEDLTTLGVGATTFAADSNVVELDCDGFGNNISTITGGVSGQILILIFEDGNCTIVDDDNNGANATNLNGSGNYTAADDDTLTLVYDGTSWYELSRSVNN